MNLFASLIVAGAVQFCAGEPAEPLCAAREIAPIEMTAAHWAIVHSVARDGLSRYRPDRGDDVWNPNAHRRDCEDQVLWQLREYRRLDPALFAAARPVIVLGERARGVRSGHLLIVIETTDGPVAIDMREVDFRSVAGRQIVHQWDATWRAATPAAGLGGRWTPYR